MSDIKCPFCQQELEQVSIHDIQCLACPKLECNGYFMTATKDMWQELMRTRKALGIAVDALKSIDWCAQDYANAQGALDEITALEQKDVK